MDNQSPPRIFSFDVASQLGPGRRTALADAHRRGSPPGGRHANPPAGRAAVARAGVSAARVAGGAGAPMARTAAPEEVARVREWLRVRWAVHQGPLREAEELLGEVRTGDGGSGGDRLRLAEEAAEELAGVVPRVLGHSDLNPANVIVHPDGIGVVDWVWATDEKLPLLDWFHFVAHRETQASFGPAASAADWRRVLARLVDQQTPAGQLLKSGAVDLAASLDLTPRQAGLLFRLYLCSRLHNIIRRDVGDAAEAVTQAALPALSAR